MHDARTASKMTSGTRACWSRTFGGNFGRQCYLTRGMGTKIDDAIDQSVTIQDVTIKSPPKGSGRPDLVPCFDEPSQLYDFVTNVLPCSPTLTSHLRWMLQKDLVLQQDFLLLGPAVSACDRRLLLTTYAALLGREIEYISITRDTSDADLKQRKEIIISSSGSGKTSTSSCYVDQAPVRAALNGRLLILDGLEKAERNVLPTLNNLLENRELALDDGTLLVSSTFYDAHTHANTQRETASEGTTAHDYSSNKIRRVHPDFRVAALGSFDAQADGGVQVGASSLDPPLRSRFQARAMNASGVAGIPVDELLDAVAATVASSMNSSPDTTLTEEMPWEDIRQLVTSAVTATQQASSSLASHSNSNNNNIHKNKNPAAAALSLKATLDAARHWASRAQSQPHLKWDVQTSLNAHGKGFVSATDVDVTTTMAAPAASIPSYRYVETPTTGATSELITNGLLQGTRAVAFVGPKGCGKSAIAAATAETIMSTRASNSMSSAGADAAMVELFSLYKDMSARDLLMRRMTSVEGDSVWAPTPLVRAAQQGSVVILDGIDKVSSDTLLSLARLLEWGEVDLPDGTRLKAAEGFGVIALGLLPSSSSSSSSWITPEVSGMFFWVQLNPLPSDELRQVLVGLFPSLKQSQQLEQLVQLRDRLMEAVQSGAADTQLEAESLELSLRRLKHICRRLQQPALSPGNTDEGNAEVETAPIHSNVSLSSLVHDALMTSLMPPRERRIVDECMRECGIIIDTTNRSKKAKRNRSSNIDGTLLQLDEALISKHRRTPTDPMLVPNPGFTYNAGHAQVLQNLVEAHAAGERALLIMGYQGVGKNRVVDYLLNKLQAEREYVQLHRDTTVASLLSSPTMEHGVLVHRDSPLVRAASKGRILVMDEADKAPVEVVALLKGLMEDGQLALPDGRVLRFVFEDHHNDTATSTNADNEAQHSTATNSVVPIHPDFSIWALANPAGYPFHGNALAEEMGDVFSCHNVPALDRDSQFQVLQSYGPTLSKKMLTRIIDMWQELQTAHARGTLAYPFSIREAVSVVKHVHTFPHDGLDGALENVVSFDQSDEALMKQLKDIFESHGVRLRLVSDDDKKLTQAGGISTPKTRSHLPKYGKVDPDNTPHVGGNTWAGGTGGSDTAGLGGRGGPYRLDAGHPVHQVSDEMKAEVSEEAQRRARQMADEGLAQKLEELQMGKYDWERYNDLRKRVALPIQQLQVHLKDIQQRKEERLWLRRQSTGELDDSRLVDALAGETDVFKRRGLASESSSHFSSSQAADILRIKLVVDVSASMYRFNSYDGRLERLLEATLLLTEALRDDKRFELHIVGHNGSQAVIPLWTPTTPNDAKSQLKLLESMVAHTQYTMAGDSTLEALEAAMTTAQPNDLMVVVSDANLKRYRIDPNELAKLVARQTNVHAHLILISSFGEEAYDLAQSIPNGRAQVCMDSEELPLMLKTIVASATKS
jgi:MoxR-like ATPase